MSIYYGERRQLCICLFVWFAFIPSGVSVFISQSVSLLCVPFLARGLWATVVLSVKKRKCHVGPTQRARCIPEGPRVPQCSPLGAVAQFSPPTVDCIKIVDETVDSLLSLLRRNKVIRPKLLSSVYGRDI